MSDAAIAFGPVLIVEDDALLAEALSGCLVDVGAVDVRSCASATEAMVALAELRPTVLVLDVALADRDDGWGIAELARELSATAPTIIFSTGSPEASPQDIAQLGTIMAKPYAPQALAALVMDLAAQSGLFGRLRRRLSGAS